MNNQTTQGPTPETDAYLASLGSHAYCDLYGEHHLEADFARKLERERDEAREQNQTMREAIKDIYYLTEGCADGAPDASAHDKLCNEIAAKLQLFIKP
jgi:hypothetical protein